MKCVKWRHRLIPAALPPELFVPACFTGHEKLGK